MLLGRQVQVGAPPQAEGTSAQNGSGGEHGGGSHPGPDPPEFKEHNAWYVHPAAHWPPSGSRSHTRTPPPQLGWTQTWLLAQGAVPQSGLLPPAPPSAPAPPAPVPPVPVA